MRYHIALATAAVAAACASDSAVSGAQPSFELSRRSVAFDGPRGGVPSQAIEVVSAGRGPVSGLRVSVAYDGLSGWLAAELSRSTAPATLLLAPNELAIPAGTYHAVVRVSAPDGETRALDVIYASETVDAPAIAVDGPFLCFGPGGLAFQNIKITNGGTGALTGLVATVVFGAGQPGGWLALALSSPEGPAELNVDVSQGFGTLPAGTYTATVVLNASGATNGPLSIPITLLVGGSGAGGGSIVLSERGISVGFVVGITEVLSGSSILVSNSGTGPLENVSVTITYGEAQSGWLRIEQSGSVAPFELRFFVDRAGLLPGRYTAQVNVIAPLASNSPQTINFQVTLQPLELQVTSGLTDADGSGTVTGPGINCTITRSVASGDCFEQFPAPIDLVFVATPAPGSRFEQWLGGCQASGTNPRCELRLDEGNGAFPVFRLGN
jgi:hypothetical protein